MIVGIMPSRPSLACYVDHLLVIGRVQETALIFLEIRKGHLDLRSHPSDYFLGIEISKTEGAIFLSQRRY